MTNPYQTLHVEPDATIDQIRDAYRDLAKKHHPDHGGDAATFRLIQEAYDLLCDPERRQLFDTTGATSGPSPEKELINIFAKLAETFDVTTSNLVDLARKSVLASQEHYAKESHQFRQQAKRFAEAAARITVKSGKLNPARELLLKKGNDCAAQADESDTKHRFGLLILKQLENYEYRTEYRTDNPPSYPPPPSLFSDFSWR